MRRADPVRFAVLIAPSNAVAAIVLVVVAVVIVVAQIGVVARIAAACVCKPKG